MWKRVREWAGKQRLAPVLSVVASLGVSTALVAKGALLLRQGKPALPPASGPRAPVGQVDERPPQQVAEAVLQRNFFDSQTGALPWLDPASVPAPADAATDAGTGPLAAGGRCGDELRLFASVVNAREPERSLAALRKDGKTHLVAVGAAFGDLTLAALYPTHAFLTNAAGTTCFLPVYVSAYDKPPEAPPPPPPPEPPATASEKPSARAVARRPPAFSEEELQKNIRQLGPQSYAVTKELFLRARQNPSGISRGTRFTARMEEGRSTGMQISKIRNDSLLSHLGLQRGDVVRRLNGYNLATADGVLEAFGHLSKSDKMSLTIERDGQPQTLRYILE